ncbi:MAG: TatD family hydrolase [archaeon]
MIDVHCHIQQKDYDSDRDEVIKECQKELKAVINSSPYFPNFGSAIDLHKKYPLFLFNALAIHPIYIEKMSESTIKQAIDFLRENKELINAIGETGLDYYHIKNPASREKQKEMFVEFIRLAKELDKTLLIHCRDAFDDCISILEKEGMKDKKVVMHLFSSKEHIKNIIENNWGISIGPSIMKSKDIKKIARDMPLSNIMLETDSPWFGFGKRNTPLSIKQVAAEIAEIKKITFEGVWKGAGINAIKFFDLPIKI